MWLTLGWGITAFGSMQVSQSSVRKSSWEDCLRAVNQAGPPIPVWTVAPCVRETVPVRHSWGAPPQLCELRHHPWSLNTKGTVGTTVTMMRDGILYAVGQAEPGEKGPELLFPTCALLGSVVRLLWECNLSRVMCVGSVAFLCPCYVH